MTTTKCLREKKRLLWQSRIAAGAGMVLLMVATASGQNQPQASGFKRIPGKAQSNMVPCPVAGYTCYPQSIAAGPNGTVWLLGTGKTSEGDYYVYQRQGSSWVRTDGAGTQIAVGIDGYPWVITHSGTIYYWNGSTFVLAPGDGCATSIGVGPSSQEGNAYGTPWVIGCNGSSSTDGNVYVFAGGQWSQWATVLANRIAVSPEGDVWAISSTGNIFCYDNGCPNNFSIPGCATSIAVGDSSDPGGGPAGDAWITGCGNVNNQGAKIFQFQNGTSWVRIPGVASQISVSPSYSGNAVEWVVTLTGEIFVN